MATLFAIGKLFLQIGVCVCVGVRKLHNLILGNLLAIEMNGVVMRTVKS